MTACQALGSSTLTSFLHTDEQCTHHRHAGSDDAEIDLKHAADGIGHTLPGNIWLFYLVREHCADNTSHGCDNTEAEEAIKLDFLTFRKAHVPQ